jgi:hypothetical protein
VSTAQHEAMKKTIMLQSNQIFVQKVAAKKSNNNNKSNNNKDESLERWQQ